MISYNLVYSQVEKLDFSLEEAINFAQLNNTIFKIC